MTNITVIIVLGFWKDGEFIIRYKGQDGDYARTILGEELKQLEAGVKN